MLKRAVDFIFNKMPVGVIVFDKNISIVFCNRQAEIFFKRHKPPDEIKTITRTIFDALRNNKLKEQFPGEIYLYKKLEGSSSNWTFRFHICEEPDPFVCVFMTEEPISNKINLNNVRSKFRLTRRETDVLRRALNGFTNIEIADELELSEQTVKDYLSNIYIKTDCENRFALLSFLLNSHEFHP